MSARELITGNVQCIVNQEGDRGPISQELKEVMELVSSTNQRIEDCAVEWQAKISQAQWRILDTKPVDNKPWEQSVLARTYFSDKVLDDAFQGLLKHNKTFTDHLQNFVALVRGEQPTMAIRQTSNAQNQCSEFGPRDQEQLLAHGSLIPSLDLSVWKRNPNTHSERVNSDSVLTKAQQSFTDLIKAKIDFDTKFLGFEANLNGNACPTSKSSLPLCQICSRILGCGMQGEECKSARDYKNAQLYRKTTRRSKRIKRKRLAPKASTLNCKERKVAEKTLRESVPNNSCSNDQSTMTTGEI